MHLKVKESEGGALFVQCSCMVHGGFSSKSRGPYARPPRMQSVLVCVLVELS